MCKECVLNGFDSFLGDPQFLSFVSPPTLHPMPPQWGGWVGTVEEDVCGQLRVTMRYRMPRYCNGGLAMGVWQWGSSDMRSMSVYGIGIATMGWGGGGIHPHPMCGRGSCQLGLHYVRNVYLERFRPGAICT